MVPLIWGDKAGIQGSFVAKVPAQSMWRSELYGEENLRGQALSVCPSANLHKHWNKCPKATEEPQETITRSNLL